MMTNFSRPPTRDQNADTRSYVKRAVFFGAGLLLLYLALQLMPTDTAAAEVVSDEAGSVATSMSRPNGPSFGPGMLLAVLILVGGSVFAYVLRRRTSSAPSGGLMETLADMPITQDQRIRLVRVQDEVLLLGITSGQISVLQAYDADEFSPDGTGTAATPLSPAFADMLRQAANRYRNLPRN